ncbi:MAG TPA: hypothetical protein QGH10_04375, partial [Armatimonadota bacterium]|nr:hypothetical protein [Armatimonadota bacterium]
MPTTRAGPGCRHPLLHTLRCLAASPAVWDITAILRQTPEDPHWGPAGASHYWAEPELGYDLLRDEHVIRKHCEMLTDAGIDVLIFDAGNGRTQATNYLALCRVFRHVRDGGGMTPQIAFMANPDVVREVHFEFYSQDLYPELWFRWLGKPLILSTSADPDTYEEPYRSFFTIRRCWDSTYGKDAWSWIAWHPQGHGWHETEGEVEQMSASFARHPTASVGRSYSNGKQPPIDRDALTGLEHLGIYFDEQMSRVHEMDPKFPLICQWNEWTAGRHVSAEAHGEGMFGRPAQPGGTYFVDEYNMEFSRDAEPMKGGFGDSYYHQLTSAVRRFKGVRAPDPVSPPQEIAIDGRFGEWADVKPEYRDHIGDTQHRLAQGYARGLFYTNTTGRNDLVAMKVARDDSN